MSEIKCFTGVLESFIEADRIPVIEAVCDAIEGFCEATCCVYRDEFRDEFRLNKTGCGHSTYNVRYLNTCVFCGRRVIERFDILKEEGV